MDNTCSRYKKIKRSISDNVPPAVFRLYRRLVQKVGYFGNYKTWSDAEAESTGYDGDEILRKVREATLKVKQGEAIYERDSVLFDRIQHSWPVLAGLLWIATKQGNRLSVLDFGGSLGSSYRQNKGLLDHLATFEWSIVEQENFVRCGQREFQDHVLRFYLTIDDCLRERTPNVVLLSSVLPYVKDPYGILAELVSRRFDFIIIDRTPLLEGDEDRLTVQQVPGEIYSARYPAWMLGRRKLISKLSADYYLVEEFGSLAGNVDLGDTFAVDTGFIFCRKDIP